MAVEKRSRRGLHVIHGTPEPDSPAKRVRQRMLTHPKPASMVSCHRCSGREVIETKTGVLFANGKAKGGTKTLICVTCLLDGHRVVLV